MPATCMTQEPQPATAIESSRVLTAAADLASANGAEHAGAAAAASGADGAAAAASAIARLRRRLSRLSTLEDPAVRRELRRLDQQLAAQLDGADRAPGRHRSPDASRSDPATQ